MINNKNYIHQLLWLYSEEFNYYNNYYNNSILIKIITKKDYYDKINKIKNIYKILNFN